MSTRAGWSDAIAAKWLFLGDSARVSFLRHQSERPGVPQEVFHVLALLDTSTLFQKYTHVSVQRRDENAKHLLGLPTQSRLGIVVDRAILLSEPNANEEKCPHV